MILVLILVVCGAYHAKLLSIHLRFKEHFEFEILFTSITTKSTYDKFKSPILCHKTFPDFFKSFAFGFWHTEVRNNSTYETNYTKTQKIEINSKNVNKVLVTL